MKGKEATFAVVNDCRLAAKREGHKRASVTTLYTAPQKVTAYIGNQARELLKIVVRMLKRSSPQLIATGGGVGRGRTQLSLKGLATGSWTMLR